MHMQLGHIAVSNEKAAQGEIASAINLRINFLDQKVEDSIAVLKKQSK